MIRETSENPRNPFICVIRGSDNEAAVNARGLALSLALGLHHPIRHSSEGWNLSLLVPADDHGTQHLGLPLPSCLHRPVCARQHLPPAGTQITPTLARTPRSEANSYTPLTNSIQEQPSDRFANLKAATLRRERTRRAFHIGYELRERERAVCF